MTRIVPGAECATRRTIASASSSYSAISSRTSAAVTPASDTYCQVPRARSAGEWITRSKETPRPRSSLPAVVAFLRPLEASSRRSSVTGWSHDDFPCLIHTTVRAISPLCLAMPGTVAIQDERSSRARTAHVAAPPSRSHDAPGPYGVLWHETTPRPAQRCPPGDPEVGTGRRARKDGLPRPRRPPVTAIDDALMTATDTK